MDPAARARNATKRLARPRLADQRAEERRAAADDSEQEQEAPGRPLCGPGERSDDTEALGRVVEGNPITSVSASVTSSAAADCPIARPSEKLWSPMPVAIMSASQALTSARQVVPGPRTPPPTPLRARASSAALGSDPTVVIDEAHQPGTGAEREQRGQPRELEPRATLVDSLSSASSTGTTPWAKTS